MNKVLSFIIVVGIGFVVGYLCRPQPGIVVKTEYKTDTLRIVAPGELRIDTFFREVLVPKTIVQTDTIRDSVWVYLPFERKVYEDSTYRAIVSGYKPVLEEIDVFSKQTSITREKSAPLLSPYVSGGVGLNGDVEVGGGLFIRDKDAIGIEYDNRGIKIEYIHKF